MHTRGRVSIRYLLIAFALVLPIALSLASSRASAAVTLADAPAERAQAVSGNVAPVLSPLSDMTLGIDQTADQTLHATDADGNAVTFIKVGGPSYMTVTTTSPGTGVATGNVHLAPGSSDAGLTLATVAASDGSNSSSRSFQINVQGPPAAPVLTQPGDMTVDAGDVQTQILYASDSNGDPLGFYLVSGPAYVTVVTDNPGNGSATGEIIMEPGLTISETAAVTIGVSDGTLTDQKSMNVTVNRVNAGPILTQPSNMIAPIGQVTDQGLSASDPNGDALTFSKVSGPAYMTVTTVDALAGIGNVRLTTTANDSGPATGTVQVSDGTLSDQKSFSISVRNNSAPYLYPPDSMTVLANMIADQFLSAYDNDGDPLTFSKVAGPPFMTVTTTYPGTGNANGNLHLAPGTGDVGYTSATVRVSDGALYTDGFLTITVLPANQGPMLGQPANMSLTVGEVGEQSVAATDQDGAYIYIYKSFGPAYVDVYGSGYGQATAFITARPGTSDVGTANVSITASDYSGGTDTKSFMITVQAGNFPTLCSTGSFAGPTMFVSYGLIEVQTADLDGDGFLDLVAESPDEQRVAVLLGAGDGSFSSSPLYLTTSGRPVSGAIADFNADEIPDLAITNYSSNSVSVFLGDGLGGFGARRDVGCGGETRSIVVADVNRDGKLDFVVTRPYMNSLAVLRGAGNGTFSSPTSIAGGNYPWVLQLPDLNRDGAPDLVVTNSGDNDISVFLNGGTGVFGSRTDYAVGSGALGIAAGDLNGDGNPDVVAGSNGSNYLSVFLGNGDGSLGSKRSFPTDGWPSLIAIADLNGDGYPDLASANNEGNDVSVLLGNGTGAFAPRTNIPAGYGPYGIAAGDFNDDLRTDLVTASYYGGSLTLLLNNCAPVRDHPPVVHAPKLLVAAEGVQVAFAITADDPDGPLVTSLTASFAGLPLGNNATFTADPGYTGGSFAWTPGYQDARTATYPVIFTATNVLSGSATTKIRVNNTNRAPVASAGGPYSAFAGSPLTLNGTGSADPDGDALTYSWVFGDGSSGTGATPMHTYAAVGVYAVALTASDGTLYDVATTTANIVGMLQARAFTSNGNKNLKLSAGKPQWCVNVEPVGKSYSNVAVDLTTLVMKSPGTGSVDQIHAIQDKVSITGDHDANGVDEIEACFTKADLRELFSNLHGTNSVTVTIEGTQFAGGLFRAQMDINVQASGGQLAATISPNPLNPDAVLTFYTETPGFARVDLFDLRGRMVRRLVENQSLAPGYHDVRIDGRDDHGERLASGVYFFRIHTGESQTTGQFTILK